MGNLDMVSSTGSHRVEQQDPGADVALDTDEARALSVRLYAVLTSYLRGSALQLSRSMSSSKNGLQLWKVLVNQYAPATKQRSLAISQAIATYPGFTRDKTFAESIAGLEQLVNEYLVVTNKKFDECATAMFFPEFETAPHFDNDQGDKRLIPFCFALA